MRGKGSNYMQESDVSGITPAYAGKRSPISMKYLSYKDHPRLCGEKHLIFMTSLVELGSPPPMRGKVLCCGHAVHARGITPPMRGKVQFFEKQQDRVGITPAYAGKS